LVDSLRPFSQWRPLLSLGKLIGDLGKMTAPLWLCALGQQPRRLPLEGHLRAFPLLNEPSRTRFRACPARADSRPCRPRPEAVRLRPILVSSHPRHRPCRKRGQRIGQPTQPG